MILFSTFFIASFNTLAANLSPYYGTLFSEKEVDTLGDSFAIITGAGSAIMIMAGGWLCDQIGLTSFVWTSLLFAALSMVCVSMPYLAAQYVMQPVFCNEWSLLYALFDT